MAEVRQQGELRAQIGDNIRRQRERRGMSQEELARQMREAAGYGWHQQTVARSETGARRVSGDELLALADLMDISVVELMRSPGAGQRFQLGRAIQLVNDATAQIGDGEQNLAAALERLREAIANAESAGMTEDAAEARSLLAKTESR